MIYSCTVIGIAIAVIFFFLGVLLGEEVIKSDLRDRIRAYDNYPDSKRVCLGDVRRHVKDILN